LGQSIPSAKLTVMWRLSRRSVAWAFKRTIIGPFM
jgi:hypothetical protein